jgi:hypothetical protein
VTLILCCRANAIPARVHRLVSVRREMGFGLEFSMNCAKMLLEE